MAVTIHAGGSGFDNSMMPIIFTLSTGTGIDPTIIMIDTVDGSGAITACHIQYPGYYNTATPSNPVSGTFSGGGTIGMGAQFDIVWTPNTCALARGAGLSNMRLKQDADGQVLHIACYDGLFENLWLEGGELIAANPCAYTTFRNIVGKYNRTGLELAYLHNCVDIDGIDLARTGGSGTCYDIQVSECGRDVTVRNFRISSFPFSGGSQAAMQIAARRTKVQNGTIMGSQGHGVSVVSTLPISPDDRSLMFDVDNVTVINPTTHGIGVFGTRGKITGNRVLGTPAGSNAIYLADGSEQCIIANNTLGYAGPNQVAYAAAVAAGTGYAIGDTITLANGASGVCLTPAVLTVNSYALQSCALNAAGSGYAPDDTVTLAGGTAITEAVVTVATTKLVSVAAVNTVGITNGYAPGDGITLAGGTFSAAASLTVSTTKVLSATVAAGGSGATMTGNQSVTGTTGTGTKFEANVHINTSGVMTSVNFINIGGQYTVNPTDIAHEPVMGAGLMGAQLSVVMGVKGIAISTAGSYTANTNTFAQGTTTGGGSDVTFDAALFGVETFTLTTTGEYSATTASFTQDSSSGTGTGATFNTAIFVVITTVTSPGAYSALPTDPVAQASSSGSGTGATFDITWRGMRSSADTVFYDGPNGALTVTAVHGGGMNYAVDDVLELSGGTYLTPARLQVNSVSGGAVTAVTVLTPGHYSTHPTGHIASVAKTGIGSLATFDMRWTGLPYAGTVTNNEDFRSENLRIVRDGVVVTLIGSTTTRILKSYLVAAGVNAVHGGMVVTVQATLTGSAGSRTLTLTRGGQTAGTVTFAPGGTTGLIDLKFKIVQTTDLSGTFAATCYMSGIGVASTSTALNLDITANASDLVLTGTLSSALDTIAITYFEVIPSAQEVDYA